MLDGGARWNRPAYPTDAGYDLNSITEGTLEPGERLIVHTGVHLNMPDDMVAYVMPRSGLAAKQGVTVLNAPGVIDSGYTGEIGVCLINHGDRPFEVEYGDNIAQLVFHKVEHPDIEFVEYLPKTKRSGHGFGSTGR